MDKVYIFSFPWFIPHSFDHLSNRSETSSSNATSNISTKTSWLVRHLSAFQEAEYLCLAMEYVPGADFRGTLPHHRDVRSQAGVHSPRLETRATSLFYPLSVGPGSSLERPSSKCPLCTSPACLSPILASNQSTRSSTLSPSPSSSPPPPLSMQPLLAILSPRSPRFPAPAEALTHPPLSLAPSAPHLHRTFECECGATAALSPTDNDTIEVLRRP
jgi:hypothetical protein